MLRTHVTNSIALILITIFLISTDISIFLNIPFFRQIMGFIFLAFVPGALFLCILKLDQLSLTEKFVLSVALSISFIMLIGILINTLYPIFGYETPLSLKSLVISLTFALLMLTVFAHLRGGFVFFCKRTDLRLDTNDKAIVLIPILFLPLSVLGMHIMNTTGDNALLMALLFLIPVCVILISLWHNRINDNAYPLIIFMTSLSLVLLLGMRSSHVIGADAHVEYYVFEQTLSNEKWQILFKSTIDSCLAISVLPAIFQTFLNTNPEYLFKILYPILFSISPLVVYIIAKEYLGNIYSFLASVFFLSQITFLYTAANARTTIAILFFALSIMVLQNGRLSEYEKRLLLIIFIFSCVVSHYSTAYIFFGILLFNLTSMQIINRLFIHQNISATKMPPQNDEQNVKDFTSQILPPRPFKSHLTLGILMIFFMVIFIWYSQVTGVAFDSGVEFIIDSMKSMQDFFILESRDEGVAMAFSSGVEELGVPSKISFVFKWLSVLFIAAGVLISLYRYHQKDALSPRDIDARSSLSGKRIDIEFLSLGLICSALMVICVALPFVSKGYGIDRVYLLATVVLSSFFVLGGMTVAELIRVRWKNLVVLLVLVPLFMCTTGIMYQVFGYPGSIVLNSEGDSYDIFYIHDQETHAAKWIKSFFDGRQKIYLDWFSHVILISQGLIEGNNTDRNILHYINKNIYITDKDVYLRYPNVVYNKVLGPGNKWHNVNIGVFSKGNLIYINGGSKVISPSNYGGSSIISDG